MPMQVREMSAALPVPATEEAPRRPLPHRRPCRRQLRLRRQRRLQRPDLHRRPHPDQRRHPLLLQRLLLHQRLRLHQPQRLHRLRNRRQLQSPHQLRLRRQHPRRRLRARYGCASISLQRRLRTIPAACGSAVEASTRLSPSPAASSATMTPSMFSFKTCPFTPAIRSPMSAVTARKLPLSPARRSRVCRTILFPQKTPARPIKMRRQ